MKEELVRQEELVRLLAIGYLWSLRESGTGDPCEVDSWMEVGELDINLCGSFWCARAPERGLVAFAYPAGWVDELPEPLFSVAVELNEARAIES